MYRNFTHTRYTYIIHLLFRCSSLAFARSFFLGSFGCRCCGRSSYVNFESIILKTRTIANEVYVCRIVGYGIRLRVLCCVRPVQCAYGIGYTYTYVYKYIYIIHVGYIFIWHGCVPYVRTILHILWMLALMMVYLCIWVKIEKRSEYTIYYIDILCASDLVHTEDKCLHAKRSVKGRGKTRWRSRRRNTKK